LLPLSIFFHLSPFPGFSAFPWASPPPPPSFAYLSIPVSPSGSVYLNFLHIHVNIYWNIIFLSYHTSAVHEHDIYLTSVRLPQYWSRVNGFETTRLHLTFRWLKHNCGQLSFSQVNANIWFLVKFQSNMTFTWL
jgi:hypothetical protein